VQICPKGIPLTTSISVVYGQVMKQALIDCSGTLKLLGKVTRLTSGLSDSSGHRRHTASGVYSWEGEAEIVVSGQAFTNEGERSGSHAGTSTAC